MSYVALSRCKTLEGLHLLNFKAKNVKPDARVLSEYQKQKGIVIKGPLLDGGNAIPERLWYTTGAEKKAQDILRDISKKKIKRKNQPKSATKNRKKNTPKSKVLPVHVGNKDVQNESASAVTKNRKKKNVKSKVLPATPSEPVHVGDQVVQNDSARVEDCLLYTSPSPRD